MNDNLWALIGSGVLFTTILGIYDRIRNRRFEKAKQSGDVKLNEAQLTEIVTRTSTMRTDDEVKAGEYWMGQFAAIRKQLEEQQNWRNRAAKKWREHKRWDDKQAERLRRLTGEPVEPAPSLDPDDDDPYERYE